jgi:flagellar assembly factor FliW
MKMKIFNEIHLSTQLPSNNTYVLVLTLSSPHLILPIDYTFNVPGEMYHQLGELWLSLCGDIR